MPATGVFILRDASDETARGLIAFVACLLLACACTVACLHRCCIVRLRRRFPLQPHVPAPPQQHAPPSAPQPRPQPLQLLGVSLTECHSLMGAAWPVVGMLVTLAATCRYSYHASIRVYGPRCNPVSRRADGTLSYGYTPQLIPSISSATGHAPASFAWRFCIAMMLFCRAQDGLLQYCSFGRAASASAKSGSSIGHLNAFVLIVHTTEQACLALLTFVGSNEVHWLHECGFVGFCIASVLHMGSSLLLFRCCYASELRGVTGTAAACASGGAGGCSSRAARLRYAYSWRKGCAAVNAMLLLLAALLFWRHDLYCEPYVYSAFALCEWLFVASNVAFMSAVFIDGLHWHNAIFDAELPAPAAKCQ